MTITKNTLLAVVSSVTAFSGWAQDNTTATSGDNLVVTANRFPQPVSSVLASTSIVTKDDIDRWQSKNLLEVMRRLPGVDIAQTGVGTKRLFVCQRFRGAPYFSAHRWCPNRETWYYRRGGF